MIYDLSIAQLRGTYAQLKATNDTVASGRLCKETDTNRWKVGTGAAYNSTAYILLEGEEGKNADVAYDVMTLSDSRDEAVGGGPPSGAAGGDLAGTYPNPTVPGVGTVSAALASETSDRQDADNTLNASISSLSSSKANKASNLSDLTSAPTARANLGVPNVYFATLSNLGAITVDSSYNQLGGTPVWATVGGGEYTLTITGAFTAGKTFITCTPQMISNAWHIGGVVTSADVITVHARDVDGASSDPPEPIYVKVEVYPS